MKYWPSIKTTCILIGGQYPHLHNLPQAKSVKNEVNGRGHERDVKIEIKKYTRYLDYNKGNHSLDSHYCPVVYKFPESFHVAEDHY